MSLKAFISAVMILLLLAGMASASLTAPTTYSIGYKLWGKYHDMMGENGLRNGTIGGVGNNVTFLDGSGVTFLPISGTTSDLDMNNKNITNARVINSTQVNVTTMNATNMRGNGSEISELNASNISSGVLSILYGGTGAATAAQAAINLGLAQSKVNVTSNTTLTASDQTIFVNASASNVNITMPTAIGNNNIYRIRRVDNLNTSQIAGQVNNTLTNQHVQVRSQIIQASRNMMITGIGINIQAIGVGDMANMSLYSANATSPISRLSTSSSKQLTTGWNNYTLNTTYNVSSEEYIAIAFQVNNSATVVYTGACCESTFYFGQAYGAFPLSLADSTSSGNAGYNIVLLSPTPYNLTINTTGGQAINSSTYINLDYPNSVTLQSDNHSWWTV